jgi:hypothetical protein
MLLGHAQGYATTKRKFGADAAASEEEHIVGIVGWMARLLPKDSIDLCVEGRGYRIMGRGIACGVGLILGCVGRGVGWEGGGGRAPGAAAAWCLALRVRVLGLAG